MNGIKIKEKLRHLWHDIYYALTFRAGSKFALSCKQVAEHELSPSSQGPLFKLRLKLHLSLCQACVNYVKAGQALKHAARALAKKTSSEVDLEKLNRELLEKYGSNSDSGKDQK